MSRLIFLLGGARSGKSSYAEQWARDNGEQVLFVATAQAFDDEMQSRIENHQASRPANWQTLEEPIHITDALSAHLQTATYDTILLDCITLLTSNILLSLPEDALETEIHEVVLQEIDNLLKLIAETESTWLVISNEVGMGVVPPTHLGRFYRDVLGRANQQLAAHADNVLLLVAGLAWKLKG